MEHGSRTSSRPRRVTPATDRVGTSVAGWTVERLLGVGPVCESWLAVAPVGAVDAYGVTPGTVVRVLREPFASDPQARAEWLGASWAPNRFAHARVPRVVEEGDDERGAPLVVRRLAHGRPLDAIVRKGRLRGSAQVRVALQLAEQLLDALEMAHAHRIVHGALTPSNVIVTERQTVRLVDFAIPPGVSPTPDPTSCPTSDAFGALGGPLRRAHASPFTAPEGEPTEAADVWSVGACLFFALTGAPPPRGLSPGAAVVPGIGRGLSAVLERALAVDPDDRYGSAYAMLGDVRRVLAGRPPRLGSAETPVSSRRSPQSSQRRAALATGDRRDRPHADDSGSGSFEPEPPTDRSGRRQLTEAFSDARPMPAAPRSEWRGNALLFLAIALVAAAATFVLMRERLADLSGPVSTHAPAAR
jgi:serine/threonine protein kinase